MPKHMPWDDIVTGGVRVIGPCVEDDVVANPGRGDVGSRVRGPSRDGPWRRISADEYAGLKGRGVKFSSDITPSADYTIEYLKHRPLAAVGVDDRGFVSYWAPAARPNPGEILDSYHARRGDRIAYAIPDQRYATGFNRGTGTVVMASGTGDGWVLNIGGAHGTPQVIRHEHVVRVTRPKRRPPYNAIMDSPRSNPAPKVGDIVMMSAQHLRSTGQFTGPEAFTKWRITSLSGDRAFSIANLESLGGADSYGVGTRRKVNVANLVLADRRHLEPNPGPSKRDPQHQARKSLEEARLAAQAEHLYGFACGYCGDQSDQEGDEECPRCGPFGTKPRDREKQNPPLILVHALNPPVPVEVERAWMKFHGKNAYSGTTRDIGHIPGTPDFTFALGTCVALEIDGQKCTFSKRPWLVCSPDDDSLWVVSKEPMNIGSGLAGKPVGAVTYDPPRASGKDPNAVFRHEFDAPLPTLDPVGSPRRCRAILLSGGAYKVAGKEWIYS